MKKFQGLLLIAILALCSTFAANAQIRFGIKAGLNVDKMHLSGNQTVKEMFDIDQNCGFTGGVMMEAMIPAVGLGADISAMYTYLNAENKSALNDGKFAKNFIEIPVNLKYKLTIPVVASIVKPYVFTGPAFAFKLDKNTIEDFYQKNCQVTWNLGLGVELFKHVQVGACYGWNINGAGTYVLDMAGIQVNQTEVKAKNNYWTITAAYLF